MMDYSLKTLINDQTMYICLYCKRRYKTSQKVSNHFYRAHNKNKRPNKNKNLNIGCIVKDVQRVLQQFTTDLYIKRKNHVGNLVQVQNVAN